MQSWNLKKDITELGGVQQKAPRIIKNIERQSSKFIGRPGALSLKNGKLREALTEVYVIIKEKEKIRRGWWLILSSYTRMETSHISRWQVQSKQMFLSTVCRQPSLTRSLFFKHPFSSTNHTQKVSASSVWSSCKHTAIA